MSTKNVRVRFSETGANKVNASQKKINNGFKSIALSAVSAYAGIKGVRKIIDFTREAGRVEAMTKGFNKLAASSGLSADLFNRLDKATDGTMKRMDLLRQANNAMLLGFAKTDDQLVDLFDGAQRLAQVLGKDAAFGVESLVTGIGRQSRLMLDNLGIIVKTKDAYRDYAASVHKTVDALTAEEQKMAFTAAAIESVKTKVAQLGPEALTVSELFDQAASSASDVAVAIGSSLSPAIISASKFIKGLAEEWLKYLAAVNLTPKYSKEITTELQTIADFINKQSEAYEALVRDDIPAFKNALEKLNLTWDGQITLLEYKLLLEKNIAALEADYVVELNKTTAALEEQSIALSSVILKRREWVDGLKELIELHEILPDVSADLRTDFDLNKQYIDHFADSMVRAAVYGQSMGEALVSASKAITTQIIADIIKRKIVALAADAELTAGTAATATAIGSLWATPAALAATATLGGAAAAGAAGIASTVAIAEGLALAAAHGADFETSGPRVLIVGDNPGGRERVQVTPIGSPNINGPQGGGITVNFYGPVTDRQYVRDYIMPEINRAVRLNA